MRLWYCSFATETKFLGGALTVAETFEEALRNLAQVNPGGEALAMDLPLSQAPRWALLNLDRLMSREEMEELGGKGRFLKELTPEERAWVVAQSHHRPEGS